MSFAFSPEDERIFARARELFNEYSLSPADRDCAVAEFTRRAKSHEGRYLDEAELERSVLYSLDREEVWRRIPFSSRERRLLVEEYA